MHALLDIAGHEGSTFPARVAMQQITRAEHSDERSHLAAEDGEDALRVHKAGVAKVVKATRLEDLGAGLEPHSLAKLYATVLGQDLGRHAAKRAKHGPASMDQLELTVLAERLWVRGQASCVLHRGE